MKEEIKELIRKFENHIDFDSKRLININNTLFPEKENPNSTCYTCKKRIINRLKEYLKNE